MADNEAYPSGMGDLNPLYVGPFYVNPETNETEGCLLCRNMVDKLFPDLTCRYPDKAGIPVKPTGRCEHFYSITRPAPEETEENPQEG